MIFTISTNPLFVFLMISKSIRFITTKTHWDIQSIGFNSMVGILLLTGNIWESRLRTKITFVNLTYFARVHTKLSNKKEFVRTFVTVERYVFFWIGKMNIHFMTLFTFSMLLKNESCWEIRYTIFIFKILYLIFAKSTLRTTTIQTFCTIKYLLIKFLFIFTSCFIALITSPKYIWRGLFLY